MLIPFVLARIGQETLTDDNFADDDIEIELAPIAVQLAYVRQVKGQLNTHIYTCFFSLAPSFID